MVPRLTLALLVLLAGCSGISGDSSGDAPTHVPTTTAGPPLNETTTTKYTPLESTESNTIEYTELSATEKRVFTEAVEHSASFFGGQPHLDSEFYDLEVAQTFEDHDWVVKNGIFYRISTYESLTPLYDIEATEAAPSENSSVIAFGNLSTPSQNYVRWAIENGTYIIPLGRSPPDEFEYGDYVRYANETYRISVGHGDVLVTKVQAEKWG